MIEAPGASAEQPYVQSATLDGQPHQQALLDHAEIMAGGVLRFEMGPQPNPAWGAIELGEPLAAGSDALLRTPIVSPGARSFSGAIALTLTSPDGAAIHFTTDGREPGPDSPRYRDPLTLDASTTIQAVAIADGRRSRVARAQLHERLHDWPVTLTHAYDPQYHAGGPPGLVDGLRGTENWRLGDWQGYQGTDFEAVVDLGRARPIRRLSSGYLQDARSWIWMPVEVEYAVSEDGEQFEVVGTVGHDVDPRETETISIRDFVLELGRSRRARFVRVRARNFGVIPDWHPGHGGEAFVFVDEIELR